MGAACAARRYGLRSPIGAQHRRLELEDPTSHTLVGLARRGFAAADARRRTGAPLQSASYPPHAALYSLNSVLRATSSADLRFWDAVAVGFLICARPASLAGLTPDFVCLTPAAVQVELRVFKYSTSGHSPLVSLHIPTDGVSDPFVGSLTSSSPTLLVARSHGYRCVLSLRLFQRACARLPLSPPLAPAIPAEIDVVGV
jgi:hypothetical protein